MFFILFGTRGVTYTTEQGEFFCPQCGCEQPYAEKRVRRFFTLFFIPIIPLDLAGEYVECERCRGTFKVEVLDLASHFTRGESGIGPEPKEAGVTPGATEGQAFFLGKLVKIACLVLVGLAVVVYIHYEWNSREKRPQPKKDIWSAAYGGDVGSVKSLLREGADPNKSAKNGRTPLHIATSRGNRDVVRELVAGGADVNAKDRHGRTPLHLAATNGRIEIAHFLIDKGATMDDAVRSTLVPWLHRAAKKGSIHDVKRLIALGVRADEKDTGGRTALHMAANAETAQVLMEAGADVNMMDKSLNTPLNYAIERGDRAMAELLITKGAKLNPDPAEMGMAFVKDGSRLGAVSFSFRTPPLHSAVKAKEGDVARLLISKGADVNTRDKDLRTALHCAAEAELADIATLLIEKGADIHSRDKYGKTALHYAADKAQRHLVEVLIGKGAEINARDAVGANALHYAAFDRRRERVSCFRLSPGLPYTKVHDCAPVSKERIETVRLLIEKGADVNVRLSANAVRETTSGKSKTTHSIEGSTALDLAKSDEIREMLQRHGGKPGKEIDSLTDQLAAAVLAGDLSKVAHLIKEGADVNGRDEHGRTALHLAAEKGHSDIAEALIDGGAEIESQTKGGGTPLHFAAWKGHQSVARLLVSKGARLNVKDRQGRTPLDVAKASAHTRIVEFLLKQGAEPDKEAK